MRQMDLDPYRVLGLSPGASLDEVKRAYRRLVQKWHPDVCGKTMANVKRFLAIKDAYVLLKERLEASSRAERRIMGFPLLKDLVDGKSDTAQGIFCFVQIPIEKALTGTKVDLELSDGEGFCPDCSGTGTVSDGLRRPCSICNGQGFRTMQWGDGELKIICRHCSGKGYENLTACPRCKGTGLSRLIRVITVNIPPGTKDGTILKFPGHGPHDEGKSGNAPLFVEVELINPHGWIIHGRDIIATMDIDCWTHLGGGYITVQTVDGPVEVFVRPGQDRERLIRLEKRGWVDPDGIRGDMLVRLNVLSPLGPPSKEAIYLIDRLRRIWPCGNSSVKALL